MENFAIWQWFVLVQRELLFFAGVFFLIGSLDELMVDLIWFWLKLTGRLTNTPLAKGQSAQCDGRAVIFIPTWQEASVIGTTIRHALQAWPQANLRLYIGCYRNDPETLSKVISAAHGDPRLRVVINDQAGPTTKADCLNRLYRALQDDEARQKSVTSLVVLHDAEDMVDADALPLIIQAMRGADMVQIPVLPIKQTNRRWVSGHYQEEFAEAHGKAMIVRDALGAAMPLAGVGCAISRDQLAAVAEHKADGMPFSDESLTEDYELGLGVADLGGRSTFIRARRDNGQLVATRACFPGRLDQAVRQKARWMHGIAFQGWDRLGWRARPAEIWMRLRDRRGPFAALVLALGYILLAMAIMGWALTANGLVEPAPLSHMLYLILALNLAGFIWRAGMRFAFTTREYGWQEGLWAIVRIPVANIIAIMAGRRAFAAYWASLMGQTPQWEKTDHSAHPAVMRTGGRL